MVTDATSARLADRLTVELHHGRPFAPPAEMDVSRIIIVQLFRVSATGVVEKWEKGIQIRQGESDDATQTKHTTSPWSLG